jgi:hypothetical protein
MSVSATVMTILTGTLLKDLPNSLTTNYREARRNRAKCVQQAARITPRGHLPQARRLQVHRKARNEACLPKKVLHPLQLTSVCLIGQ